ncbi:MAG TPA: AAA domain-containing protein [Anaerolineae bacterium]|nr:AAA domain-containing protein [Anaerolineae bacterium]
MTLNLTTQQLITYWQRCLQEGEATHLPFDTDDCHWLQADTAPLGRLPTTIITALFDQKQAQNPTKTPRTTIPVLVTPFIYHHGRGHRRQWLAPVIIRAQLDQYGQLHPSNNRPWIPRPHLAPSPHEPTLGLADDYDQYLLDTNDEDNETWDDTYHDAAVMLDAVSDGTWTSILAQHGYQAHPSAAIFLADEFQGFSLNILQTYAAILAKAPHLPLLDALTTTPTYQPARPLNQLHTAAQNHLGHFHRQFPLSPSQRRALYHHLSPDSPPILAISGPPGTGKTTLLHSLIASHWVTAAINASPPPIMVVSSTNNQAVTNVLDSLRRASDVDRWLPIDSFGLYLTNSRDKQKDADDQRFLWADKKGKGFPRTIENPDWISTATDQFLDHYHAIYGAATYSNAATALNAAVDRLHTELLYHFQALQDIQTLALQHQQQPTAHANIDQQRQYQAAYQNLQQAKQRQRAWILHHNQEPPWFEWFRWLPTVQTRRRERNQAFINHYFPRDKRHIPPEAEAIFDALRQQVQTQQKIYDQWTRTIQHHRDQQAYHTEIEAHWREWCQAANAPQLDLAALNHYETDQGQPHPANLYNWLDTHLRRDLFALATHYWEGRWLQTITARPSRNDKRDRDGQIAKWRRYAMLTPCFVTTMHTGPSFFTYYHKEPHYLFNTIDLLIIDEAGQVAPELTGAMFALAQQAIVVGDQQQIQPVWRVSPANDQQIAQDVGLATSAAAYHQTQNRGLLASQGSLMALAAYTTPYQTSHPHLPAAPPQPGLLLTEHRRSVPAIINYCNELAYQGQLQPRRQPLTNHPWPPLSYYPIEDSHSARAGGSRYNAIEATTITKWLYENKEFILKQYRHRDLTDIVAILTPFTAQKRLLRQQLKQYNLHLDKVGTIHALQGGERPLVIFSPVYTLDDHQPYFFDRGPNMLNVAVSRAQDSFLYFGDPRILNPDDTTPSALLARHLFRHPSLA